MGRLTPNHDESIKEVIYAAAARKLKVPAIVKGLANGTLPGLDAPYPMSESTVRYYWEKGVAKAASEQVTELAAGDPSRAIDQLARRLLSEADKGIEQVTKAKTRDPKATREWADVLKVLAPLVRPEPLDDGQGRKARDKPPSDPLTARLTTPPSAYKPSPVAAPAEKEDTTDTDKTNAHDTPQPNPHHGGVAARAPETGLNGGGVGIWPRPAASVPFGAGNGTPGP